MNREHYIQGFSASNEDILHLTTFPPPPREYIRMKTENLNKLSNQGHELSNKITTTLALKSPVFPTPISESVTP